jgi:phage-related protein
VTYPEGIYILHAFEKETQQTPKRDLERAQANYAEVQKQRAKSM